MGRSRTASRLTAISHDYGTCVRTCAELLIYPFEISHEQVTALLKIQPTEAQNKGDEIQTIRGKIRIAKATMWLLSSEPHVESKDVRAHLDWLLEQLFDSHEALHDLQQQEVLMSVNCPWWSLVGHGGPTLWPEQMQQLSQLNLECSFDVQFHPEDESLPSTF